MQPLSGLSPVATRHREYSTTDYQNTAGEGRSSLAFAAARPEVLRVSPVPLHGPFTGLTACLTIGESRPSCTLRHTYRRHRLRYKQHLADRCLYPLLGFPKIAPPSSAVEESTPTSASLRPLRVERSHRSTTFHPHGFPPSWRLSPLRPCTYVATCCRPWGS